MTDCKLILGVFLLSLACCDAYRRSMGIRRALYFGGGDYVDNVLEMREATRKAAALRRVLRGNPELGYLLDGVKDTLKEGREAQMKARIYRQIFGTPNSRYNRGGARTGRRSSGRSGRSGLVGRTRTYDAQTGRPRY